jgi:hypothetical protein
LSILAITVVLHGEQATEGDVYVDVLGVLQGLHHALPLQEEHLAVPLDLGDVPVGAPLVPLDLRAKTI